MTFQIGLVCTDGVVIASDQKIGTSREKHLTSLQSKFLFRKDRNILACWNGDKAPSRMLADEIVSTLTDAQLQYPHPVLQQVGEKVLETSFYPENVKYDLAEAMLVTVGEEAKLYEVRVQRNAGKDQSSITCECPRVYSKCVGGHRANAATFFSERYCEKRPMEDLVFFAAHSVLTAEYMNPAGIGGLEIVLCSSSRFEFLSNEKIAALKQSSENVGEQIRTLMFSP